MLSSYILITQNPLTRILIEIYIYICYIIQYIQISKKLSAK